MIVVLDDVPDADTIAPLLPRGGPSAVLITARQRLPGIADASALTLGVLPEPDAITLFTLTAGRVTRTTWRPLPRSCGRSAACRSR